ncbi:GspH/FimT family pseudopilin [Cupriavidus respiraculi]|uniref:Type II secretion system protein H n=2 Tax=Cupriavidus respiraculi TaxID=195930 RepID=A0ABN7Z102_9BURK|nr:hypothetical protein LMG21510_03451 [Cupriavidus respiraculi]
MLERQDDNKSKTFERESYMGRSTRQPGWGAFARARSPWRYACAPRHRGLPAAPGASVRARGDAAFPSAFPAGFTLIELLVAITIVAIFAAMAVPNFGGFLRNSRLDAAVTALTSDFAVARSEAARRNRTVTVCPTADNVNCADDWTLPRVIFVDTDGDNAIGAAEERIRNGDALGNRVAVVAANLAGDGRSLRYRSFGNANALANWQVCEAGSTAPGRSVGIGASGRPNVRNADCA